MVFRIPVAEVGVVGLSVNKFSKETNLLNNEQQTIIATQKKSPIPDPTKLD